VRPKVDQRAGQQSAALDTQGADIGESFDLAQT